MSPLHENAELLARFRAGDAAALTEVYRAYARPLDRLLRRGFTPLGGGLRVPPMHSRSDRDDLIQETFERAFADEARLAYDGKRDYWRYLANIARNALVSHYRRHHREVPAGGRDSWAEGEVAQCDLQDEPAPSYEDPRAVEIMHQYVASLPEPLRAVHSARHVEGLTERAAVQKLGVTRWFLQSREHRLRRELLLLLKNAGVA